MLSVLLLVVALSLGQLASSGVIPEANVEELQRLEDVLEEAAMRETEATGKAIKRVTREHRMEDGADEGNINMDALKITEGELDDQVEQRDPLKRVTREEPQDVELEGDDPARKERDSQGPMLIQQSPYPAATGDDIFYPLGKSHFNLGLPTHSYPSSPGIHPHITFHVPPPQIGYNIQRPILPITSTATCQTGHCGGQTIHIHDTHLATQHVPQSYTATVPFISGYRLTPVIGQKMITLNDWYGHHGAAAGAGLGCENTYGYGGYQQHIFGHGRNSAMSPEDAILKPFEQAMFFQQPMDQEPGLSEPEHYQETIDSMKKNIEHLESVRDNAKEIESIV